ncbi:phage tail tape measure protein [Cryobacterium sp. LW097]|uniref:phage tail tape measure protein n=1 Tax=Cryobacterium sp. LW097 TaxID=1978566 RepID=UPI000B4CF731|nr:phage tail tape measure protein [Cryobacterium sp. LW097]ASD21483.1 phage tail tape measure protein [Cryobacterium sp. LW097]
MSGSAMFEAGSIGFRLQMIGAQVFHREAAQADAAVAGIGTSATAAARAVGPLSRAQDTAAVSNRRAAVAAREAAAEVERLRRESAEAAKSIGMAALGIGAAFAAVAALTIGTYATFDEASSKTAAATMATREQQDLLKESAIEQGAASVYSAREAADAQTELAKAGVSVNDILGGGLSGSLALAAAGELAVARAAEIAATTLTVFSLKGDQAGHVADLLAAGAGKAQGSVDDLALGLDYVGVTFARLNIPLEDTVGTLALLASNGLLGEKAGTGLRSVISSLTAPVAKGAEEMAKYGINVFDTQKNFIGMAGVAEELKTGLGDLDEQTRSAALGAIFGAEAASAAGILFASGAAGVEEWNEKVNDQGYAAEQAALKTDNLTGDLERLGGSMDSALIKTGSTANDTMREMVQLLTGLVDWYGNLDEGAQATALGVGVGTAAVFLFGGTAMLAVPKIVEFRAAITSLNTTMKGTAIAGGVVGLALTAAVVILGAFAVSSANASNDAQALSDTLDTQTGAITENTRAWVADKLQKDGSLKAAKELGVAADTVVDAFLQEGDAIKTINKALAAAKDPNSEYRKELERTGGSTADMAINMGYLEKAIRDGEPATAEAERRFRELKEATAEAGGEAADAAPAYVAVEDAVDGVVSSISDLVAELDELNGQNLSAREAARALEEAYDSFDESLAENGAVLNEFGTDLDTTTEAGRAMQSKLDDIASAAMDTGQAIVDSGQGYDQYRASLESSRAALLVRIDDLGISGQAAQDLADKILHIPSETEWAAYVSTEDANAKLADTEARALRIKNLLAGISVSMGSHVANGRGGGGMTVNQADGGVVSYYGNGGLREQHVAQVERAGAMRVWAEPETGGEAYIPLAAGKRGRSSAILADVAGKFGYQLVPAGSQAFAGGAVVGGGAAPAGGPAWTGDIVIKGHTGDDSHLAKIVRREINDLFRGMSMDY